MSPSPSSWPLRGRRQDNHLTLITAALAIFSGSTRWASVLPLFCALANAPRETVERMVAEPLPCGPHLTTCPHPPLRPAVVRLARLPYLQIPAGGRVPSPSSARWDLCWVSCPVSGGLDGPRPMPGRGGQNVHLLRLKGLSYSLPPLPDILLCPPRIEALVPVRPLACRSFEACVCSIQNQY